METNNSPLNLYELPTKLDILKDCDMILSAPVEDNIIQVGMSEPTEFTQLNIVKNKAGVLISRADKQSMQVQVNNWPKAGSRQLSVFDNPASELRLIKLEPGRDCRLWQVEDGLDIKSPEGLFKFTEIICKYALIKQVRESFAPIIGRMGIQSAQNR